METINYDINGKPFAELDDSLVLARQVGDERNKVWLVAFNALNQVYDAHNVLRENDRIDRVAKITNLQKFTLKSCSYQVFTKYLQYLKSPDRNIMNNIIRGCL